MKWSNRPVVIEWLKKERDIRPHDCTAPPRFFRKIKRVDVSGCPPNKRIISLIVFSRQDSYFTNRFFTICLHLCNSTKSGGKSMQKALACAKSRKSFTKSRHCVIIIVTLAPCLAAGYTGHVPTVSSFPPPRPGAVGNIIMRWKIPWSVRKTKPL